MAEEVPRYSSEYSDGAHEVILRFLLPLLDPSNVQAATIAERFAPVPGHRMAKAAVEAAVLDAEECIAMGACSVVNVKPSRVGGLLEAVRIRDVCLAAGVDLWCGGMLETGIGRAANVALAALEGFTLPGDISASDRYFVNDLSEPFVLDDGYVRVPSVPGLGRSPLVDEGNDIFVGRIEVSLT